LSGVFFALQSMKAQGVVDATDLSSGTNFLLGLAIPRKAPSTSPTLEHVAAKGANALRKGGDSS
jgi:hypothetical protein